MASLRISVFTDQGIYWYTNIKQNPKTAAVFKYAQIDSYHLIFSYLHILKLKSVFQDKWLNVRHIYRELEVLWFHLEIVTRGADEP